MENIRKILSQLSKRYAEKGWNKQIVINYDYDNDIIIAIPSRFYGRHQFLVVNKQEALSRKNDTSFAVNYIGIPHKYYGVRFNEIRFLDICSIYYYNKPTFTIMLACGDKEVHCNINFYNIPVALYLSLNKEWINVNEKINQVTNTDIFFIAQNLNGNSLKEIFGIPYKYIKLTERYYGRSSDNVRRKYKDYIDFIKKYGLSLEQANNLWLYLTYGIEKDILTPKILENRGDTTFMCTYRDYRRLLDSIPTNLKNRFPKIPECVLNHDYNKLNLLHDRVQNIYYEYRSLIESEKLVKLNKQYNNNYLPLAKTFEFQNNKYIIKACEKLEELTKEGMQLHHCVGSYKDSVSQGKEYILFLRKVEEPDTPFYTIDITPDKNVRQIHGSCNCNMTEEIKPFIHEWAEKFGLDISNTSGLKCALC